MGNREDLLAGAKRCLYAKGYARTTARDIAAASGVSLSAIGYHYGTKEALLNAALYQAMEEWGDDLSSILSAEAGPDATPADRFEAAWEGVIASFAANRPLWAIQFEIVAHSEQLPELRRTFSEANRQARLGLVELFGSLGLAEDGQRDLLLGSFYQVLLSGVAAQWLLDPEGAPSGHDLLDAVRTVAEVVGPGPGARS
ncbi:TetR/AcrR family transcriptional regulator [Streptosporangium canum]